jgi:hypothetical protein
VGEEGTCLKMQVPTQFFQNPKLSNLTEAYIFCQGKTGQQNHKFQNHKFLKSKDRELILGKQKT